MCAQRRDRAKYLGQLNYCTFLGLKLLMSSILKSPSQKKSPNKKRRERLSYLDCRLKRLKNIAAANKKNEEEGTENNIKEGGESAEESHTPHILMARTVNLTHEPFEQTQEVKVNIGEILLILILGLERIPVIGIRITY